MASPEDLTVIIERAVAAGVRTALLHIFRNNHHIIAIDAKEEELAQRASSQGCCSMQRLV